LIDFGPQLEYGLLRMDAVTVHELARMKFDHFVSAFNRSERVEVVHSSTVADSKHWLIHPEYCFDARDLPTADALFSSDGDELEFWLNFLEDLGLASSLAGLKLCFDITGMMRPHVLALLKVLKLLDATNVTFLYADPLNYKKAERTEFSGGPVNEVRQVRGFEGSHTAGSVDADILVIGTGYDDSLIRHVADSRAGARKLQLFGLPSLQPHMYQENHLRVANAAESLGPPADSSFLFAPANDPFATALILQAGIRKAAVKGDVSNIYLSPLGTKPQVLGFGLFYLCELVASSSSIVLPFASTYSQESAVGVGRIWKYVVDFDWFP
jgi:hypothetical protein